MRSGDWIVRLGIGATVFISFAAGAEERPSMRETVGCHAAAQLMVPKDTSSLFEFRDVFRPNSEEAAKHEYEPIAWGTQERELVLSRLRILFGGQTPGLLDRAAADGALSLYRAKLTGFAQAKGGYLRLTLDGTAFPKPGYDWLTRIIAHELVHSADPYNKLSADPAWNALVEPRITAARALLAKEGLTIIVAASLPISDRRTKLDKKIQQATGLPSAYSAYSTEETIAEVVSFMLDKDQRYEPPPPMAVFLRKWLLCPASIDKDPSGFAYREGLRQAAVGSHAVAVTAFSEAIHLDLQFMFAYMERAEAFQRLNANVDAVQDFSTAIALAPLYSNVRPYLLASRGLLQLQAGNVSKAAVDCTAALPLKDNYYNSLLLCGRVKLAELDFAGAIADLEAAIKILPNYQGQVNPWLEKARAGLKDKVK